MVNSKINWKKILAQHPQIERELYIYAFSIEGIKAKDYIYKLEAKLFEVIEQELIEKIEQGTISLADFIRHKGFEVSLLSPYIDTPFYGYKIYNAVQEIAITSTGIITAQERDEQLTSVLIEMLAKTCVRKRKMAIRDIVG
jgi:hypothetical protein